MVALTMVELGVEQSLSELTTQPTFWNCKKIEFLVSTCYVMFIFWVFKIMGYLGFLAWLYKL